MEHGPAARRPRDTPLGEQGRPAWRKANEPLGGFSVRALGVSSLRLGGPAVNDIPGRDDARCGRYGFRRNSSAPKFNSFRCYRTSRSHHIPERNTGIARVVLLEWPGCWIFRKAALLLFFRYRSTRARDTPSRVRYSCGACRTHGRVHYSITVRGLSVQRHHEVRERWI